MSMMERYINSPGQHDDDEEEDAYRGQNGFGNGQSPISVGTSVTGGANTPQEYLAANPGSHAKGNRHHNPLVNGSGKQASPSTELVGPELTTNSSAWHLCREELGRAPEAPQ